MTTRRFILKTFAGAACCAALPLSAIAHRQKTTLTDIRWNAETRLLEVTHLYHMHDAESALAHIGVLDKPDLTSLKARAKLALYTEKHFALKDSAGDDIPLEIVGAEFEGHTVYVYQQAAMETPPKSLKVSCTLLRDVIDGQINNVDVTLDGEIHSLLFRDNDKSKTVPG